MDEELRYLAGEFLNTGQVVCRQAPAGGACRE